MIICSLDNSGVKLRYFYYMWKRCAQRINLDLEITGRSCYGVRVVEEKHHPLLKSML